MNLMNRYIKMKFYFMASILAIFASCKSMELQDSDGVRLRYFFKEGQVINTQTKMKADIDVSSFFSNSNTFKMLMDISITIKKIHRNGEIDSVYQITRIKARQGRKIFDTVIPKTLKKKRFKILLDLLKVQFPVTMTKDGKIENFDMAGYHQLLKKYDLSDKLQIKNSFDKLMNNSFVSIPDKPVKEGDIFPEIIIKQELPNVGELNMYVKYLVRKISVDKRYVYLKPQIRIEVINRDSKRKLDLKDANFSGEIIFDTKKGFVTKTKMIQDLDMVLYQGRRRASLGMKTWVVFEIIEKSRVENVQTKKNKSKKQFLVWLKSGPPILKELCENLAKASSEKEIVVALNNAAKKYAEHSHKGKAFSEIISSLNIRKPEKAAKQIFDQYGEGYDCFAKERERHKKILKENKNTRKAMDHFKKIDNGFKQLFYLNNDSNNEQDEWSDM